MDLGTDLLTRLDALAKNIDGRHRVQIGWEGLFPAEGKCFAEVLAPGGPIAKVFGRTTTHALQLLAKQHFRIDPVSGEQLPSEGGDLY